MTLITHGNFWQTLLSSQPLLSGRLPFPQGGRLKGVLLSKYKFLPGQALLAPLLNSCPGLPTNFSKQTWGTLELPGKKMINHKKPLPNLSSMGPKGLDILRREFLDYLWSMRTLDRRLRHFDIFHNDNLRTFALIVSAHPYCARAIHSAMSHHIMHQASALRKLAQHIGLVAVALILFAIYSVKWSVNPHFFGKPLSPPLSDCSVLRYLSVTVVTLYLVRHDLYMIVKYIPM